MTIISALPNTISNGQPADAVPLMADLNHIVNQVNANGQEAGLAALLAAANTFTLVQSGVAATSPANFPIASQVQNFVFNTLTSTVGTNTVTARVATLALSAYANGQIFTFLPTQVNSGPVTLNINDVGAAQILGANSSLMGRELSTVIPCTVRYQSPNFHLISPAISADDSFLATLSSDLNNMTGAAALRVIGFDTVLFNRGATLTSTTFTAKRPGVYRLGAAVGLRNLDSAAFSTRVARILLSSGSFQDLKENNNSTGVERDAMHVETLTFMNAGETAVVDVQVAGGGTNNVDIRGTAAGPSYVTYFYGTRVEP